MNMYITINIMFAIKKFPSFAGTHALLQEKDGLRNIKEEIATVTMTPPTVVIVIISYLILFRQLTVTVVT